MEIDQPFSAGDMFVGLAFALACFVVLVVVSVRQKDRGVLILALINKSIMCWFYNIVIIMRNEGDSLMYHNQARHYAGLIISDLMNGTTRYLESDFFLSMASNPTYRISNLCGLVHFFFLGSFLASSLFFAVLGLWGQILLYRVFSERFPDPRVAIWWKVGLLFFPSLVFWSAGILKDSMGIFGLGISVWAISRLLSAVRIRYGFLFVAGVYLLLMFRPVVLPPLLAACGFWLLEFGSKASVGPRRRRSVFAMLLVRGAVILPSLYFMGEVATMDQRLSLGSVEDIAERLQSSSGLYKGLATGGSTVEAMKLDLSLSGIFFVWPQVAVFTLYRPFLWEAHTFLALMAAFENLVLFGLTVLTVLRFTKGLGHLFDALRYPLFWASMIFTLMFITGVGFSTPNLGSVSRYRIPMLPFFVAMLVILHSYYLRRRSPIMMGAYYRPADIHSPGPPGPPYHGYPVPEGHPAWSTGWPRPASPPNYPGEAPR